MYNSIYPININYSNKYRKYNGNNSPAKNATENQNNAIQNQNSQNQGQGQNNDTFPNGTKVAVDYTKGQINISQVLTDFRSTIIAINAPDNIKDEVNIYLGLVEKESLKENPSKEIIVSNLKNASKISDDYIASALGKQSNVVEGWIKALFMQNVILKSDPKDINPDFALKFPQEAQEKIDTQLPQEQIQPDITQDTQALSDIDEASVKQDEKIQSKSLIELPQEAPKTNETKAETREGIKVTPVEAVQTPKTTPFSPTNEADKKARELFSKAKKMPQNNTGDTEAVNLLNEALGILSKEKTVNPNIRAAIHLERGNIFNLYDYVDYALRDYKEAAQGARDYNLKAKAHYKSGTLYDEFNQFSPALDNYLSSVAYSGEADNINAQTLVLSKIAGLYSKKFDLENTKNFSNLALDTAKSSENNELIARTYSSTAQNYQYMGENDSAIKGYKNALMAFHRDNESFEQMAYNYRQAAIVMKKLGNTAKAEKLLSKANQYHRKALQQMEQSAKAG